MLFLPTDTRPQNPPTPVPSCRNPSAGGFIDERPRLQDAGCAEQAYLSVLTPAFPRPSLSPVLASWLD